MQQHDRLARTRSQIVHPEAIDLDSVMSNERLRDVYVLHNEFL